MSSSLMSDLVFNEVAVMEDDWSFRTQVTEALMGLGCAVHTVENADEAVELVERHKVRSCILDIDMGTGRGHEGLDALERIKQYDRSVFAGVLTCHLTARFQALAKRLGADFFQPKSANPQDDICAIVDQLLLHAQKQISEARVQLVCDPGENPECDDPNIEAFERLRSNEQWVAEHAGHYVALVEGQLVDIDADEQRLLGRVTSMFPDTPKLVMPIEEQDPIVDLPSPLSVEQF